MTLALHPNLSKKGNFLRPLRQMIALVELKLTQHVKPLGLMRHNAAELLMGSRSRRLLL